jgi:hypothetical protein
VPWKSDHKDGKQTELVLDPSAQRFSTTVALVRGPLPLTATFRNEKGEEICGAYYAQVSERMSNRM